MFNNKYENYPFLIPIVNPKVKLPARGILVPIKDGKANSVPALSIKVVKTSSILL